MFLPISLTSQAACEAISKLNTKHLKVLGILSTIFIVRPSPFPSSVVVSHDEVMSLWWSQWLQENLKGYQDINLTMLDFLHLESLSCIKYESIVTRALESILSFPVDSGLRFHYKMFSETDVGKSITKLWESGLNRAYPTTVGILIGIYVSDMLHKTTTSLDGWGES